MAENHWLASEGLKTGRIPGAAALADGDMVQVLAPDLTSEHRDRLRIIAATRAAQRGVPAAEKLIEALLSGKDFLGALDTVTICDLHPYSGEFNIALMRMRAASTLPCRVRLVNINLAGKNGLDADYAIKRTISHESKFVLILLLNETLGPWQTVLCFVCLWQEFSMGSNQVAFQEHSALQPHCRPSNLADSLPTKQWHVDRGGGSITQVHPGMLRGVQWFAEVGFGRACAQVDIYVLIL